jgi:hypothetical protein
MNFRTEVECEYEDGERIGNSQNTMIVALLFDDVMSVRVICSVVQPISALCFQRKGVTVHQCNIHDLTHHLDPI